MGIANVRGRGLLLGAAILSLSVPAASAPAGGAVVRQVDQRQLRDVRDDRR
jgi:hypothetical protein